MDCNEQQVGAFRHLHDPDRTTRLANVTSWTGCVLAVIWLAVWLHDGPIHYRGAQGVVLAISFGGAAVIWMIGRAIRYVWIGK